MNNKLPCFECQEGHYEPINQVYEALLSDGNILTVPDIDVLTCVKCGDECLDSKNSIKIDKAREAYRINKR
jgi:YgiT-type zinc finger domain-containing protein